VKSRSAVQAVAIEEREPVVAEGRGSVGEIFGQRSTLKKTEGGSGMELDVRRRHGNPLLLQNCRIAELQKVKDGTHRLEPFQTPHKALSV
jgi:hypothetical protein